MPNYHFTYASDQPMPEDQAVVAEVMRAWEAWFAELGADVVDPGAMLAPGTLIGPSGAVHHSPSAANGYSIVRAHDLDDALAKAKGCPVLHTGGSVEISECLAH